MAAMGSEGDGVIYAIAVVASCTDEVLRENDYQNKTTYQVRGTWGGGG